MKSSLYNPFEKFSLRKDLCFLTGETDQDAVRMSVFPSWLMSAFDLDQKAFKLLNENYTSYKELQIPASLQTAASIENFENKISDAFMQGYEQVSKLDEKDLFLWFSRIMYGLIYNEIESGLKGGSDEPFRLSPVLIEKFSNHHAFLQALINPKISFDDFRPWSIFIFNIDDNENTFDHRSEINTLTFAFRMKDMGIIICMQDNGAARKFHADAYEQLRGKPIHPAQFQEISARVFYTSYLFNRIPCYYCLETSDEISINTESLMHGNSKPVYDEWINKIYAQVLEALWKEWNFSRMEILTDPDNPLSLIGKDLTEVKEILASR